jgi:biofilm PGA synthesis N-glycosyltransferase PgaC
MSSNETTYVVITAVRNEVDRVDQTIASMIAQTLLPSQWVIVDDGSSDGTDRIIDAAAKQFSWISTVHRPDRGCRKPGGGVVEAFYDGYRTVGTLPWDFLVKLDADLSFDADYFRQCFDRFGADERLGIGGGTVCVIQDGQSNEESVGDPAFHVRGATKIYRRLCWEDVSPLVHAPGWDTIDEVKANMRGWTTRTFRDLRVIQHKRTGSADGPWLNWFKNGRGCYVAGYDPFFMLAKCARRAFSRPPLLPALALGAGFCSGYLAPRPQYQESEVVRYLRRQQRRRLLRRASIYDR